MYTCTIYTYMHHLHHQIPTKYKIYLAGLPSVLYETPDQDERSVFWIGCFCCFSCAFHRKWWFSCKKYHISWKPTKPGQYVCKHVPFTHTCTTKYYQNMIYLVGLPSVLYERPGQNERSVLNQLFLLFFRCFSVLFMKSAPLFIQKVPLFIKTNKTMSICVYTCTIYAYMHHIHHQIPPKYKIYLVGLPSVLYETPGQNEKICVLNRLFLLLFMCFS